MLHCAFCCNVTSPCIYCIATLNHLLWTQPPYQFITSQDHIYILTSIQAADDALACTLSDGILRDPYNRTGSIVANYQFQFDGPPQAGAIYTGGFSVCSNGSLALGPSTRWYRCMSGAFGNLYDRSIGEQCAEVRIVVSMSQGEGEDKKDGNDDGEEVTATPTKTDVEFGATRASPTGTAVLETELEGHSVTVLPTLTNESVSMVSESLTEVTHLSGTPQITDVPAGSTLASLTAGEEAATSATSSTDSEGFAASTRVPRRETFGAVVGIMGAALLL